MVCNPFWSLLCSLSRDFSVIPLLRSQLTLGVIPIKIGLRFWRFPVGGDRLYFLNLSLQLVEMDLVFIVFYVSCTQRDLVVGRPALIYVEAKITQLKFGLCDAHCFLVLAGRRAFFASSCGFEFILRVILVHAHALQHLADRGALVQLYGIWALILSCILLFDSDWRQYS